MSIEKLRPIWHTRRVSDSDIKKALFVYASLDGNDAARDRAWK